MAIDAPWCNKAATVQPGNKGLCTPFAEKQIRFIRRIDLDAVFSFENPRKLRHYDVRLVLDPINNEVPVRTELAASKFAALTRWCDRAGILISCEKLNGRQWRDLKLRRNRPPQ